VPGAYLTELEVQVLDRSFDLAQQVGGDMAVTHGVGDLLVSQQHLNHADIGVLFEQVGGEGMPTMSLKT